MKKSTQQTVYFEARSLTDGTRVSGLTVTATISKDGGTATASTNSPAELGTLGVYKLTLTATETNATTLAVIPATATEGVFLPLLTAEPVESVDVSGLATTANITSLQTHGDSTWSTADVSGLSTLTTADIPTAATVATAVWNKDLSTYTYAVNGSTSMAGNVLNLVPSRVWDADVSTNGSPNSAAKLLRAIPTTTYTIPTAAQIAAAVNAPSAATIAAAVNAPSAATIASKVMAEHVVSGDGYTLGDVLSALPTAAQNATAVWNAVVDISSGTYARNALYGAYLTGLYLPTIKTHTDNIASDVWGADTRTLTASPTDVSGLATSAELTALQAHGDSTWSTADVSGLSTLTTADIPTPPTVTEIVAGVWDEVPPILAQIVGLLGNWAVVGNTLTTYASDGTTVLKTYTLTRDADGEITRVTGAANA